MRMKQNISLRWLVLATLIWLLAGCGVRFNLNPTSLETQIYKLPVSAKTISFDDFTYDPQVRRVIIPARETGDLALIDPITMKTLLIPGFSQQSSPDNPMIGATSATAVNGLIFVLDKSGLKIHIVDPQAGKIVGSAPVLVAPDLIRYVPITRELWVTEKASEQIEIFKLSPADRPSLQSTGVLSVTNGPEALLIDNTRGVAYTNQPMMGLTAVIDLATHRIISEWGNGCSKARSMALDEEHGYLFVACNEGKLVMIDVIHGGLQITSQTYGGGLDFVAYNPRLGHIYLPSGKSAVLAIFAVSQSTSTPAPTNTSLPGATPTISPRETPGPTPTPNIKIALVRLGTADTALNAKCVISDDFNNVWLCDPDHGQLLLVHDTFPAGDQ